MSYATLAEFKAAITIDDTVDDADLQRSLDAATEWITHYTGRTFGPADATATARRFYPYEADRLTVPDVQSVTTIEIDSLGNGVFDRTLETDDYELLPLEPVVGAYTVVHVLPNAAWWFIVGHQVRITGIWGFGSVPPSVTQACILVANRFFHRPSAPFGVWESPTTGQLGDLLDRDVDVINLLSPFVTAGGASRQAYWVLV